MDRRILICILCIGLLISAIVYASCILRKLKEEMSCYNCRRRERFTMNDNGIPEVYLNTNSTMRTVHGQYNQSDNMYPENIRASQEAEAFKDKVRKLVGANEDDEVLFMSSCSEAMASVMHWLSTTAPYGIICGTDYDHKTVEENAKLYGLVYDNEALKKKVLPDNTVGVMLTHVNPTTGEILDIETYMNLLSQYKYIDELTDNDEVYGNEKILQHRPVVMLDATQSIGKVGILMHGHKQPIDVIMASLHKLGFPLNFSGVLILNSSVKEQYVPLIAGAQQGGKRGGSYILAPLISHMDLLDHRDDFRKRKHVWIEARDYLRKRGLNVYEPKGRHLYNTILIDTNNHCTLELIKKLVDDHGIYVGNKTACANEFNKKTGKMEVKKPMRGGAKSKDLKPFDNAVRISFIDPQSLTKQAVKVIADEISKEVQKDED